MYTSTIQIAGRGVEVPHNELPQLIEQLTELYQRLLITGAISALPTEGFMTYEQAEEVLSAHYKDKALRYHTSRVWGAICRLTMRGILHFETKCSLCKEPVAYVPHYIGKCRHGLDNTAVGYRLILISNDSIRSNFKSLMNSKVRTIGPSIKSDYMLMLGGSTDEPEK